MAASGITFLSAQDIQDQALLPENRGEYTLYRSDTHGTEAPVVAGVSKSFGQSVMEHLEKHPHHQGYWLGSPGQAPS